MQQKETIIAIATGSSSSGGLGVIRISGEHAKEILQTIFMPKQSNKEKKFVFLPRYMHYGFFILQNKNLDLHTPLSTKQNYSTDIPQNPFILDEILAVYFPAPFSYTGEDVAEIHAHGGSALLSNMLEHLLFVGQNLDANIRHAQAGEFTKRAFLNGRIDLSQAEAVAEIIAAPALEGVKLAAAKLSGALGKRIENLREQLEYIRRRLCLAIDFPEEEGECLPPQEFHALITNLQNDLTKLISAYERARPWREGSLVVLAGQVNAGKSSLMNAILGRKRAIVTSQAGTTRDYLEEHTFLDGLSVRLTDTAGLREIAWLVENTQNVLKKMDLKKSAYQEDNSAKPQTDEDSPPAFLSPEILTRLEQALKHYSTQNSHVKESTPISHIEAEGICRSLELMEEAKLILLIFDGFSLTSKIFPQEVNNISSKHAPLLASFMQEELALLPQHVKKICIWNKNDKAPLDTDCVLAIQEILDTPLLCMHAKEKTNKTLTNTTSKHHSIDDLAKLSRKLLLSQDLNTAEIAPNRRQAELLQKAHNELSLLKEEIRILPPDLTAIRLESASQFLASITGICSIDETFNAIFEDFCIGK